MSARVVSFPGRNVRDRMRLANSDRTPDDFRCIVTALWRLRKYNASAYDGLQRAIRYLNGEDMPRTPPSASALMAWEPMRSAPSNSKKGEA